MKEYLKFAMFIHAFSVVVGILVTISMMPFMDEPDGLIPFCVWLGCVILCAGTIYRANRIVRVCGIQLSACMQLGMLHYNKTDKTGIKVWIIADKGGNTVSFRFRRGCIKAMLFGVVGRVIPGAGGRPDGTTLFHGDWYYIHPFSSKRIVSKSEITRLIGLGT